MNRDFSENKILPHPPLPAHLRQTYIRHHFHAPQPMARQRALQADARGTRPKRRPHRDHHHPRPGGCAPTPSAALPTRDHGAAHARAALAAWGRLCDGAAEDG